MRSEKKTAVTEAGTEKVNRLVNDVMRAWAPTPESQCQRVVRELYDAGYPVVMEFQRTGEIADIVKPWGKVLTKYQRVLDYVEAHKGTTDADLVLNRALDFWDNDLKPVWSAIGRFPGAA